MISNAINGSGVNTAINFSCYYSWPRISGCFPTLVVDAAASNEIASGGGFIMVAATMLAGFAAVACTELVPMGKTIAADDPASRIGGGRGTSRTSGRWRGRVAKPVLEAIDLLAKSLDFTD